jgi:signal transduction histidine kinase
MRLAWKLFIGSSLVVIVLVAVAAWSLLAMDQLVTVNREIATRAVPALQTENAVRESLDRLVRLEARYVVRRDEEYVTAWTELADRSSADFDMLTRLVTTTDERVARDVAAEAFAAYRRQFDGTRALVASGAIGRARELADGPGRAAADKTEKSLVQLIGATESAILRAQLDAGALATRTRGTVAGALAASLVAALSASALLALSMTRSLRRLTAATTELADGTFTQPLPVERGDEIGELARSFNRMAERLQETEKHKQQFFSHISHDMRNPLTAIHAAAQILLSQRRGPLEPNQAKLVQVVNDCAHRMIGLITQILDFSKLRSRAEAPLDRRPIDLARLVARAVSEVQAQAEQNGLTLESATDGTSFDIEGDEDSLMRVVTNLVGNALKFTPQGGSVKVLVTEAGEEIQVSVVDTGLGIPAAALPTIFDPYKRAHSGHKGAGLGLAVVRGLVEAHGGRIGVESVEGEGSSFTMRLPRLAHAAV